MSLTCVFAWALALLVLPVLLLDWMTMTRPERIRRLKAMGWTQQQIADHLHCTRYQVRKALAA
jgi:hypothetical protein